MNTIIDNSQNSSLITNNINTNNIYNTTLNFSKISNICKCKINPGQRSKQLSSKNLLENDGIIYEDENSSKMINYNNNLNSLGEHALMNNSSRINTVVSDIDCKLWVLKR